MVTEYWEILPEVNQFMTTYRAILMLVDLKCVALTFFAAKNTHAFILFL